MRRGIVTGVRGFGRRDACSGGGSGGAIFNLKAFSLN